MLFTDVLHSSVNQKKLRMALQKYDKLLKAEKTTVKAKQVTITELESRIVALGINPAETSHAQFLLQQKDNEIAHLRKRLNILDAEPVQTPELLKLQEEKDRIYDSMKQYRSQMEEYRKKVDDLKLQISATKLNQTSLSIQSIPQLVSPLAQETTQPTGETEQDTKEQDLQTSVKHTEEAMEEDVLSEQTNKRDSRIK